VFAGFEPMEAGKPFVPEGRVGGDFWVSNDPKVAKLLDVGGYVLQPFLARSAADVSLDASYEDGFPAADRVRRALHSDLCAFLAAW
jgi:hypothetical protein